MFLSISVRPDPVFLLSLRCSVTLHILQWPQSLTRYWLLHVSCFCLPPHREQPIFSTRAHVFQIDPSTKKNWVPTSKHAVTVSYFYDSTRNVYRIISLDGSKVCVLVYTVHSVSVKEFKIVNSISKETRIRSHKGRYKILRIVKTWMISSTSQRARPVCLSRASLSRGSEGALVLSYLCGSDYFSLEVQGWS